MRRVKVVFGIGLILAAAGIAVSLSQAPATVAAVNNTELGVLAQVTHETEVCQSNEVLPPDTTAIRLQLYVVTGPRVALEVLAHGRVIVHGEHGSGWTGNVVTLPVQPLSRQRSGVEICFTPFLNGDETAVLLGEPTTPAGAARDAAGTLPGRVTVEYLRPGRSSWWSLAPGVARRMGLGRAWSGTWWVLLVVCLMGSVILVASRLVLRELASSRPLAAAAWLCALVACINAACWSVITPPFEVPDEPAHIAYVKQLAETGRLPTQNGQFSNEEFIAYHDLKLEGVAHDPAHHTISSRAQQEELERDLLLAERSSEKGSEYAGVAASEPPLYYALEAIPYRLGAGGTLLDRIELMRLLSAAMGGLSALFAFLFVREALPRVRWAWIVGGLGVALVPLLGFMSGAVNPDALLYAVSAALFYALARAFRRGLTRRSAIVLGGVTAIGFVTKLNFVGIAPGALLGLTILSIRAARTLGRAAYVSLAIALAVALSPVVVYVSAHVASGAPTFGIVSSTFSNTRMSLSSEVDYIWQLYLPRLPGMHNDFSGVFTPTQVWFKGYVGLYGWLDTTFPGWVYELALIPAGVIAGLCARSLLARAGAVRSRAAELAVYGTMSVGLIVLIGADSTTVFPAVDAEYGQARYLLPLLPLVGVVLALAARGAGRRWGPSVGAAIIVLFLAHDVFSQLQVVARFYG
jgi:hypothetical protein